MARKVENNVKARLQRRARLNGCGLEGEIRHTLRSLVDEGPLPTRGLGREIADLFSRVGLDADIPELRADKVESFDFKS